MAYRFRVYVPTDAGITALQIFESEYLNGPPIYMNQFVPQGISTPTVEAAVTTNCFQMTPIFAGGASDKAYRWVVNVDGDVEYVENTQSYVYAPTGAESNVQIRVEMPPSQTYCYGTVKLDANGGSLGSIQAEASLNGTADSSFLLYRYKNYTLPTAKPTRAGYTFAGWGDLPTNPISTYAPGQTISLTVSLWSPGPVRTIYAQWTKGGGGGGVWISESTGAAPVQYGVYICESNGATPVKYFPHYCDGTGWVPMA